VQAAPAAPATDAPLEVSTQLMALRAGLYAVELAPMRTTRGKGGMVLPCARLDRLPEAEAEVHVAALSATRLLEPGQYPTFMAVTADASVLLTIYKLAGPAAAPEVRIRFMGTLGAPAAAAEVLDSLPLKLELHVQRHGDVTAPGGAWAMSPDGQGAIEGLSVRLEGGLPADGVEYQAILGREWVSPWMTGGEFCGSRGLALPLVGVRIRARPEFAVGHTVRVWGRFAKGGEAGPFEDGEACAVADDTLVGLRLVVIARAAKK
jgi:hypothetical protein